MGASTSKTRKNSKATTPAVVAKPKAEKKPRFAPLPVDRAAWIAANARPAVSVCLCGCNGTTKGRFVPGHDATLKESLKATVSQVGGDENAKNAAADALATFGW
jgi:hypothetical protein